jgi:hypothetical protein
MESTTNTVTALKGLVLNATYAEKRATPSTNAQPHRKDQYVSNAANVDISQGTAERKHKIKTGMLKRKCKLRLQHKQKVMTSAPL